MGLGQILEYDDADGTASKADLLKHIKKLTCLVQVEHDALKREQKRSAQLLLQQQQVLLNNSDSNQLTPVTNGSVVDDSIVIATVSVCVCDSISVSILTCVCACLV